MLILLHPLPFCFKWTSGATGFALESPPLSAKRKFRTRPGYWYDPQKCAAWIFHHVLDNCFWASRLVKTLFTILLNFSYKGQKLSFSPGFSIRNRESQAYMRTLLACSIRCWRTSCRKTFFTTWSKVPWKLSGTSFAELCLVTSLVWIRWDGRVSKSGWGLILGLWQATHANTIKMTVMII